MYIDIQLFVAISLKIFDSTTYYLKNLANTNIRLDDIVKLFYIISV